MGKKPKKLWNFILTALGVTVVVILPVFLLYNFFELAKGLWNANYIIQVLLILISSLVLFRWIYKIIVQKRGQKNEKIF